MTPALCRRCHTPLTEQNRPLTETHYGCEHCRGKRLELLGTREVPGQEYEQSKANAG